MRLRQIALALLLTMQATSMSATSFVVPTDAELVVKSTAIAIGTVEGFSTRETATNIETVYEIRVGRTVKGAVIPGALVRVVTLGGILGQRGLLVPGEAQFEQGEQVLLFLTRDEAGEWRTTDMTLGKFRFAVSTRGERLLVRDTESIFGWTRSGQPHQEKVRREAGFLRFVEERVGNRPAAGDYEVEASEVSFPPRETSSRLRTEAAPFPAATYTAWVAGQPVRWPNISAGVTFYKRADQNISGVADGGVAAIQNGLAAWTNECGSVINLQYGGTTPKTSANHDGTNVVEYNDPQGRISGSWTGGGTVGITFISFAGSHTFLSQTWLNISDADVVFQNGYPGTHGAFAAAMTHELGHAIGWRHSNQNHQTGGACNSSVEECTSAAIMNSSVSSNYGFTLQPWDINAAQSVYPGGTCGPSCTAPSVTTQPQSQSVAAGTAVTLTVGASGTGPFTYEWYVGTSGDRARRITGVSGSSLTVAPGATTSYWVRVVNACGEANSGTATVSVSTTTLASGAASGLYLVAPCRVTDTRGGQALYPGSVQVVQVTARCGIAAGAKSVVLNITAVAPSANGTLSAYPGTGAAPPNTSTVSYRAGSTRAASAIIRLAANGKVAVYNNGPNVNYLIDVTGYFQ